MKIFIPLLLLCLCNCSVNAQTRTYKNNFSAGFGIQQYNGDLGNSFFDFEEEWYGVARFGYDRYLTRSLDGQAVATIGDIGRCFDGVQPSEPILNLRSRFVTVGLNLKYKFANGRLLREDARFAPYVYAGAALAHHQDIWRKGDLRVNEGFYTALTGGVGLTYRLCSRLQITYNLGLGYFTSDRLDYITAGAHDLYLQNSFSFGVGF